MSKQETIQVTLTRIEAERALNSGILYLETRKKLADALAKDKK